MKFKRFSAENFITFPSIVLEFDSVDKGLILVDGWNHDQGQANGAGKSVLFNSVAFSVYGKTVTDVSLSDLISESGETLKTDVSLETPAGLIRIVRTRKPNQVKLYIADVEFKGTADSVEKRILEVVGMTFEQFLQVAYFYQGAHDRFVDVNDTAKKSFLASVLGLDRCELAYTKAHKEFTAAELTASKLEGSLTTLKALFESRKTLAEDLAGALVEFRTHRPQEEVAIRKRYTPSPDVVAAYQAEVDRTEKALQQFELKRLPAQEAILATQLKLDATPASVRPAAASGPSPERLKFIKQADLYVEAGRILAKTLAEEAAIQRELKKAQAEREKLGGHESPKNCYACGQALQADPGAQERIHAETKAKDEELLEISKRLSEVQVKVTKTKLLQSKTDGASVELDKLDTADRLRLAEEAVAQRAADQEINANRAELVAAEASLQTVLSEISHRRAEVLSVQRAQKISLEAEARKAESLEREIAALGEAELRHAASFERANDAKKVAGGQVDQAHADWLSAKETVTYLQETKRIFSPVGLRAHVVDGVVAELNERIEHYLNELFSGRMQFHYELDESGKLVGKLFFSGRERSSLATLSGGQRQRVRLAVDLALSDVVSNRLAVKPNVMFLDEVTDGMDSIGREGLMSILGELERNRDAIFVADHESEFKSRFSRSIWLELKGGQTLISRGV